MLPGVLFAAGESRPPFDLKALRELGHKGSGSSTAVRAQTGQAPIVATPVKPNFTKTISIEELQCGQV
jgi:hypothetical protein